MPKTFRNALAAFMAWLTFMAAGAQAVHPDILQKVWKAQWITVPGAPAKGYGVYYFRKIFSLGAQPASFLIHVSADNRYKLFVNEKLVSLGPARNDIYHWNFETVDIAPYLSGGHNTVAAVVWNEGDWRPEAQMSHRTAFIMQGNTAAEAAVNTDASWKCITDSSYSPLQPQLLYTYYVSGPGEKIDMQQYPHGWQTKGFKDDGWRAAQTIFAGLPKGVFAYSDGWMLTPRNIPPMELKDQRFSSLRKVEGIAVPNAFPAAPVAFTVPANTEATLLLDGGHLTNAYPTLLFSGGKGASVSLSYAEALYVDEGEAKDWRAQNRKGNRDVVEGKRFVGREDVVLSNGGSRQQYMPLWWRTFRYVQVKITTKETPLVVEDLYSTFTGYPFQLQARFDAGNDTLSKIVEVGWRTARLCAFETYMDCPYYEQLQYIGDTRIQGLVSLYNSGDDRLLRNAISQANNSRMAEGITLSRYPTANAQQIPPFSLWWIGMLHDYWMYRGDSLFVGSMLPGARQVLHFFKQYQGSDGSLKNAPYWNFTDWAEGWDRGVAPAGKEGASAALDLQLLWAYQTAALLEKSLGMPAFSDAYSASAKQLAATIRKKYWDNNKGLFRDTPGGTSFSQHVNTLAILTGLVKEKAAKDLAQKIIKDTALTAATIYFKYYVHQALIKAGLGNDYLNWMDTWKNNLANGLTTWAEISDLDVARSDCHAWGSHPNIEFLRTVAGIDTDAPGFKKVKIEPHLGTLKNVSGVVPHPNGKLSVQYQQGASKWHININLPPGVEGHLMWSGKSYSLKSGANTLVL